MILTILPVLSGKLKPYGTIRTSKSERRLNLHEKALKPLLNFMIRFRPIVKRMFATSALQEIC